MKLNIVAIGNSKGIRLPKTILNQCDIRDEVDLEIEDGKIVLYPVVKKARQNWPEEFKKMKTNKDDKFLIDDNVDLEMSDWNW
jgi:antitoxin MazE